MRRAAWRAVVLAIVVVSAVVPGGTTGAIEVGDERELPPGAGPTFGGIGITSPGATPGTDATPSEPAPGGSASGDPGRTTLPATGGGGDRTVAWIAGALLLAGIAIEPLIQRSGRGRPRPARGRSNVEPSRR